MLSLPTAPCLTLRYMHVLTPCFKAIAGTFPVVVSWGNASSRSSECSFQILGFTLDRGLASFG